MAKVFEFIFIFILIILLIAGFWFYVQVIALGNPFPLPGGNVLGREVTNYNFPEPEVVPALTDMPLSEAEKEKILNSTNPRGSYSISLPSIDTTSSVISVNNLEALAENGWVVLPYSYTYQHSFFARTFDASKRNKNEAVILCHRNFYSPRDIRSCHYMDRIEIDHQIIFDANTYIVISSTTVPFTEDYVIEAGNDENYLRIITNSGPNKESYMNTHYLIIVAKKLGSD
jgi:hypothetical protein